MEPTELVSIIMPVLDAERFLAEAIESVLTQTHEHWELLVIDDGSRDRSVAIARDYAESQPNRIHLIEQGGHRGTSVARNLGLDAARGAFIAMLDADDVWLPRRLEHQLEIMRRNPAAGMVYGKTEYWFSWTGRSEDRHGDFVQPHGVPENELVQPPLSLVRFLRGHASVPCTCSALIRREVVDRVGRFEDRFTGLFDDQVLFTKICLSTAVYVSDDCLARYRRRPDSLCGKVAHSEAELEARRVFLDWVDAYLDSQGARIEELRQVMTKERWLLRRTSRWVRFGKKWLLRGEERCVPSAVQRRVWSRLEISGERMCVRRGPRQSGS